VVKQLVSKVKPLTFVHLDPRVSPYIGQRLHRTSVSATSELDEVHQLNFGKTQCVAAQEMALNANTFPNRSPVFALAIELLLKARDYYVIFLNSLTSSLSIASNPPTSVNLTASVSSPSLVSSVSSLGSSQNDDSSSATPASSNAASLQVKRAIALIDSTLASEYLASKQYSHALAEVDKHIGYASPFPRSTVVLKVLSKDSIFLSSGGRLC
jgi:hypothetical protein